VENKELTYKIYKTAKVWLHSDWYEIEELKKIVKYYETTVQEMLNESIKSLPDDKTI